MLSIIVKKNAELTDEAGRYLCYEYALIENNNVFSIACTNIPQGEAEVYTGVTDNREDALKILEILYENRVAPSYLDCVIDDILWEMSDTEERHIL